MPPRTFFATRADGEPLRVRLREPQTHMGAWCLDIEGLDAPTNTVRTITFDKAMLKALTADIVLSL